MTELQGYRLSSGVGKRHDKSRYADLSSAVLASPQRQPQRPTASNQRVQRRSNDLFQ
jgi:hypothetical protein